MMAAFDSQRRNPPWRELRRVPGEGHAGRGSCSDGHSLDSDELQFLSGRTLHVEAQRDGFTDVLGDVVERMRLRVTGGDFGEQRL